MPESQRIDDFPRALLTADPNFYPEQFNCPSFLRPSVHHAAMAYSATYRAILAACTRPNQSNAYCERLSVKEARSLSREAGAVHVPTIYFTIPADQGSLGPETIFPGLSTNDYIDLYRPQRGAAFYEVHPPAATLDEFAELLLQELKARRLIPTAVSSSTS